MRQLDTRGPAEIGRVAHIIRARADAVLRGREWRRPGLVGRGFGEGDVEVAERRHPYDGFFSVEEIRARFRRFDGEDQREVLRAVFRVTDASTVLPYDPVRDRILLVEQVRFGPLAQGDPRPGCWNPSRVHRRGRKPRGLARREAAEEAGLALGDLHFVARYYPSPGGVSQVLFSYVGIADLPDEAAGLGGHAEEDEDILGHVIGFDRAMELMERAIWSTRPRSCRCNGSRCIAIACARLPARLEFAGPGPYPLEPGPFARKTTTCRFMPTLPPPSGTRRSSV
jgi:ADP-ribose pyrophosphatase